VIADWHDLYDKQRELYERQTVELQRLRDKADGAEQQRQRAEEFARAVTDRLNLALAELADIKSTQESGKLATKEKDTLLKLIVAMAVVGYKYPRDGSKSDVPTEIANDIIGFGMSMTDDTVRKWLREAVERVLPGT